MTRNKVIYWIATGLVCAVMVYSAINFNLENPLGPMKGAFRHLGLPDYFRIELTVAKALGVLALLLPGVPSKVREFAYAGFAITLISATIAHFSVGDPLLLRRRPSVLPGCAGHVLRLLSEAPSERSTRRARSIGRRQSR